MPKRAPLPIEQRRFGAHMSIAGGLAMAFLRGVKTGCDSMQVFVKNHRQWKAKPLRESEIREWNEARKISGIDPIIAHDTYLINLAAVDDALWQQSIDAFVDELERCEALGITGLVTHPGSHCGGGLDWGIARIAAGLDIAHERTKGFRTRTLLECVAGQGTAIGYTFEQLAAIIARTREPARIGVCLDTCHLFAAGYDIADRAGYAATIDQLDTHIGVKNVLCIHSNDSKKPLGSHVDRHEHIGRGLVGKAGFRNFINDPRFFGVPMLLETPKDKDPRGREWDRVNLATLRSLVHT